MTRTKTRRHKSMRGCSKKNKSCKKTRRMQRGGNSVGFISNISTMGTNFLNSFTNVYNGLYTIPQIPPVRF